MESLIKNLNNKMVLRKELSSNQTSHKEAFRTDVLSTQTFSKKYSHKVPTNS